MIDKMMYMFNGECSSGIKQAFIDAYKSLPIVYYTVTFNPGAGQLIDQSQAVRQVADGQPIGELPVATYEDDTFQYYWYNTDTLEMINESYIVTSDLTCQAHFIR